MAIKVKNSRDTFRSNVDKRPLLQNGLEAQYQGLDFKNINSDRAALPLACLGGLTTRRKFTKVNKEYIVDVDAAEHYPTASLLFNFDRSLWDTSGPVGINQIDTKIFTLIDSGGNSNTFEFTTNPSAVNGQVIPGKTYFAISIANNDFSVYDLFQNTMKSVKSAFGEETFGFSFYQIGQEEVIDDEIVKVTVDKMYFKLLSGVLGAANLIENNTGSFLDASVNTFQDQREKHRWRLNGYRQHETAERMFYEDIRSDMLQSVTPHSRRLPNTLLRGSQRTNGTISTFSSTGGIIVDMDSEISSAIDPKTQPRFTKKVSDQIIIRQLPNRDEIFGTYRSNHTWREDPHYLSWGCTNYSWQGTWTDMQNHADMYSADLESHISKMLDANFAVEQYHDKNPLSGRIDVFNRLSRIFDIHNELIFDRHQYSVFDQFLDPNDDLKNLSKNKYPKKDDLNSDIAFEDLRGKRSVPPLNEDLSTNNTVLFADYFDQPELENHDYLEEDRYSRIDDTMMEVLTRFTKGDGSTYHTDRREWQESDFVHTATGFISSQTTSQDGIMYTGMKR